MHNLVRLRFAPSPTGPLHIGGLRTALYNYLFSKKNNGTFILRIEDTDQKRYVAGAEAYIKEALQWAGIQPDEGPDQGGAYGPYRQSERKDLYQPYVQQLLEEDKAYYAFDTPEELDQWREDATAAGLAAIKYDAATRVKMRNSLSLDAAEVQKLLDAEVPYTVRLKVDPGRSITFTDEIRGEVKFDSAELDDKVLMKADGLPTYHMANVVDDHLMKISHVVRGEEWLSSTAHHVLLYEALGWLDDMPIFAHLPLILKPEGKGKLSKRDGAKFGIPVFPLEWQQQGEETYTGFREEGFLPDAAVNFLAYLGWNPGTEQEIYGMSEMTDLFKFDQIGKSGARFDFKKALWYNSQYIKSTPIADLIPLVSAQFAAAGHNLSDETLGTITPLFQERVDRLPDFVTQARFLVSDIPAFDEKMIRKKWKNEAPNYYSELCTQLLALPSFAADELRNCVQRYVEEKQIGFGSVLPLIRLAISGKAGGPDLFSILEFLGREICEQRFAAGPTIFDKVKNA